MNYRCLSGLRGILLIATLLFHVAAFSQTTFVPAQPIHYLTDPTLWNKVVEARDNNGVLLESYAWVAEEKCASLVSVNLRQSDGTYKTLYAHQDSPCGSLTTLTDENGNVAGTQHFDAFGNILDSQGATPTDPFPILLGYRQEERDPATGLIFMHDRWYDPSTGRFISPDRNPGNREQPATLNKYVYAQNDPVNKFDPTGQVTLIEETVAMDESEQLDAGLSSERIDQLNTIVKNLCKTTSELGGTIGKLEKHHPLPQFAGAPRKTDNLVPLPEPLHDALHRLIEISFIVNGFAPPNTGKEAFKVIFQSKAKKLE